MVSDDLMVRARILQARFPIIDLHVHTLLWSFLRGADPGRRQRRSRIKLIPGGRTDLPRSFEAHVGGQFQALASWPVLLPNLAHRVVCSQISALERLIEAHPEKACLVRTADEMEAARQREKIGLLLGVEGAHGLGTSLDSVSWLAAKGVRYLGLAHFSPNRACWPSFGWRADREAGLTAYGQELVEACQNAGVMVDLSHISQQGFRDVLDMSRQPVIVSHTGASAVVPHARNLEDWQLKAIAESGGLVGLILVGFLIGDGPEAAVRHLNHMVSVCGEDHLAIGSDLDTVAVMVPGLEDVSGLPKLVAALLNDGWSDRRIAKLLRLNALRLLRDVPPFIA